MAHRTSRSTGNMAQQNPYNNVASRRSQWTYLLLIGLAAMASLIGTIASMWSI